MSNVNTTILMTSADGTLKTALRAVTGSKGKHNVSISINPIDGFVWDTARNAGVLRTSAAQDRQNVLVSVGSYETTDAALASLNEQVARFTSAGYVGGRTLGKGGRKGSINAPIIGAVVAPVVVAEAPVAEAPVAEAPVTEAPVTERKVSGRKG